MGIGTLAALSLLPIAAVGLFLVGLRWPASKAMPISYVVAVGLALGLNSTEQSATSAPELSAARTRTS